MDVIFLVLVFMAGLIVSRLSRCAAAADCRESHRQRTEDLCISRWLGDGGESQSAWFIIHVNIFSISDHISIPVYIRFSNEHTV
jgi:hypothetical protein